MAMNRKPWINHYPDGVSSEIDADQYSSLKEMLEWSMKKFSKDVAFSNMGVNLTFTQLERESAKFASYLQNELNLNKGDKIVLQMPNLLQYPIALFGILRAGMVAVNLNPLYTAPEMRKTIINSEAKAIIIVDNFGDKLEKFLPETSIKHIITTEIGDRFPFPRKVLTNFIIKHVKKMVPKHTLRQSARSLGIGCEKFNRALYLGSKRKMIYLKLKGDDVAFLQYTGGTTGIAKAAILTHRNILSNQAQIVEWMKPALSSKNRTAFAALPCYHIYCLTVNCFAFFHKGYHNVLITNPRDVSSLLKEFTKYKPAIFTAVGTLLNGMLLNKDFESTDWTSLEYTVTGGMALKKSISEEWISRTKSTVVEGYGLTEASPLVCCNPPSEKNTSGTVGFPLPSTDLKIVGIDGQERELGEEGELWVKGPQIMKGYWKAKEETSNVLTADGWLKTGDIAIISTDGYVRIVDRLKDLIIVSGFNVYPNEIEEVAMTHPKVLEAAAISVLDEKTGESVKIFLVKKDVSLTESEVSMFFKENLTAYKRPKHIQFVASLPKNNLGKVLKRELI